MKPKILVPFDFSPGADAALAWAADLQRTSGAGPIQMMHAFNSRPPGTADLPLDVLVPNVDETGGLVRTMKEAAARCGAEATAKVVSQPSAVGDIILDAARGHDAELIVMGTHGRTGLRRLVVGSVAEHVLRHADCPVVIVHAQAARKPRA
jgi:nucleotide-binding universal stress UspA family protein